MLRQWESGWSQDARSGLVMSQTIIWILSRILRSTRPDMAAVFNSQANGRFINVQNGFWREFSEFLDGIFFLLLYTFWFLSHLLTSVLFLGFIMFLFHHFENLILHLVIFPVSLPFADVISSSLKGFKFGLLTSTKLLYIFLWQY